MKTFLHGEQVRRCDHGREGLRSWLVKELQGMGFGQLPVAFIDCCPEQNELNTFAELVAVNRGVNMKIYEDVAEAERWLLRE